MSSKLARDLAALHAEDGAVQIDVLAARSARGESRCRPRAGCRRGRGSRPRPRVGRRDAREDPEERRLAGAVAADDAEHLALGDLERDVVERPDLRGRLRDGSPPASRCRRRGRSTRAASRSRPGARRSGTSCESACDVDRGRHQIVSAKRGSEERKTASPPTKQHERDATPTRELTRLGRGASSTAQRQPAITAVIGLSERIHCHFSGNPVDRVHDARERAGRPGGRRGSCSGTSR